MTCVVRHGILFLNQSLRLGCSRANRSLLGAIFTFFSTRGGFIPTRDLFSNESEFLEFVGVRWIVPLLNMNRGFE